MTRLAWRDCLLAAGNGEAVLQNAALRTRWQLEADGLALRCVENRATGF